MNVKIGMNMLLWGAQTQVSHIPVFENIASAGFDGVEISVVGQDKSDLKIMRGAIADLGMSLTASTFVPVEVNPIAADAAVRALSVDYLKERIDEAAYLGSDILVGGIYQAHKYFSGRGPTDQEWEWSRQYLREAGEHARDAGIRLGLEFLNRFEVYLINTAADAAKMCRDVGLDNVGVLYDTHHANIEDPNPAIALPSCSDHLMHVHLSESHRGTLGTGQVKWEETFATLKFLEYSGWLTIEAFGTSDEAIVGAANLWRNAFDSPEQVYTDGIDFIRQGLAH
ncbi:MAG: D-psicose/D-tagatose/L-ribulose 3-epimerase [Halioglobus sp.]|jgi:D-psicose/D-tagatose/L-ribulose 3-epimerase